MAYLGNQPVVGDSANTFKLLDDISTFTLTFDGSSASVVSVANDTLTFANHRFVTGQRVTYGKGGGTVITGLTDATAYFIIKVDQSTIKLATNASNAASSTAIDLTGLGAGASHTLNVAFDGVNTKFKATHTNGRKANVSRAAQLSLSINGVIQQPQDTSSPTVGYGVEADSTIVFSTAPVSTDKAFGSFIGEVAPSFDLTDNTVDNFTGDGSTTIFNLSREVPSSQDVLVTLDGVTQHPSDTSTTRSYSVINQALTFVSAPDDGVAIQARHIGFAGATTSEVTGFYGRTGNVALKSTDDITFQNASAGIITATTFGGNPSFTGSVSIGGTLTYEDVTNIDSVGLITARNGIVVGSGITLSKDGDIFATGVTTSTSFTGTLNTAAQPNVTSLGTLTSLDVSGGLGIAESLFHVGDTNTRVAFPDADTITLDTAGSERLRITSDGNIGIGTDSPSADHRATIKSSISPHSALLLDTTESSYNTNLYFAKQGNTKWIIGNKGSNDAFRIVSGTSDERVRITSGGSVNIGNSLTNTSRLFTAENTLADGGEIAYIGNNDGSSNYGGLIISAGETDRECRLESAWGNSFMTFYTNDGSASERFRIGSSGQIGIAGANYGTSGQVLTSQGSGSAVQWATPASASSGTYTSVGTGYYKDITTTSTNVVRYDIMFTGVSIGGGMEWQFQLGDSGGIESSGYNTVSAYRSHNTNNKTNNPSNAFRWYGIGNASFVMDGRFSLTRIHNNKWFGEGLLVRTEAGSTIYDMIGTKELSGALTTIRISSSVDDSEVFDGGHYKVIEHTGTV